MKGIPFVIAMFVFCIGCPQDQNMSRPQLTYPYVATPEREVQIRAGMARISTGMSPDAVRGILGEPDEILDLFDKNNIKSAKPIGYTWWFLVQRKTDSGSVKDRDEKLVRVSFGLAHKVTKVDTWGFEEPGEVAKLPEEKQGRTGMAEHRLPPMLLVLERAIPGSTTRSNWEAMVGKLEEDGIVFQGAPSQHIGQVQFKVREGYFVDLVFSGYEGSSILKEIVEHK